jgi:hypothetical protein
VGRVLHVVNEGSRAQRFILQWYGNLSDNGLGPQKPCFVDQTDNKRLYKQCSGTRYKPWTSATTKTAITMENVLLVGVNLTKAGKLSAEDLERLETCPHLNWSRPAQEEVSIFD